MGEEDQITEAEIEAPVAQPESMDLDSLLAEYNQGNRPSEDMRSSIDT